jgi:putative tricarboxylic transport membrane protein
MKKSATVTSLLFLGLAIGAFIASMKLPFGTVSAPAAAFFPAVLAALLAMTSLLALVSALRSSDETAVEAERLRWKKIVLTVGSLLVFALLFEILGYLAATFLFIVFLLRAVEQKSWGLAVAVAFSASFFSYLIFSFLLGAPLPAGLLPI